MTDIELSLSNSTARESIMSIYRQYTGIGIGDTYMIFLGLLVLHLLLVFIWKICINSKYRYVIFPPGLIDSTNIFQTTNIITTIIILL